MLTAHEILSEAESLPVEDRASLADSLLKTLNASDPRIDREWLELGKRRLNEIKCGKVKLVPGDAVFKKIRKRFSP